MYIYIERVINKKKFLQNLTPTAGPSRNLAAGSRKTVAVFLASSSGFSGGMFSIPFEVLGEEVTKKLVCI